MDKNGPGLTLLGKLVVLAVIAGSLAGAAFLFFKDQGLPLAGGALNLALPAPQARSQPAPGDPAALSDTSGTRTEATRNSAVRLGIAYGTEKRQWLEWAAAEFSKTPGGAAVTVDLIPMGSLEAAHAILKGDRRIHVWSPASSLYTDTFLQEWSLNHPASPFVAQERLALTTMVFVFWDERYRAFIERYREVSFETLRRAIREPTGWQGIAGKPEWGLFKFGHTDPNASNSGLATLVVMACDYHGRGRGLALGDILDAGFQEHLGQIENGVMRMSNSTGNMMRDMVLLGPSTYDALFLYESVAIDYLKSAEGRWGKLRVAYPRVNLWNDNPYYILDVPWSTAEHRLVARAFLDFLMGEAMQRGALNHGFRPGNPKIPIKFPESPFVRYAPVGIQVEIAAVADAPKAEVVHNLLASCQRTRGGR